MMGVLVVHVSHMSFLLVFMARDAVTALVVAPIKVFLLAVCWAIRMRT